MLWPGDFFKSRFYRLCFSYTSTRDLTWLGLYCTMIPLDSFLLAITVFTHGLTASPRLISRADDPSLELMECGRLPRIRVPHRAGMEVMECRPLSDSLPIDFTNEQTSGASGIGGSGNPPMGSRRSSSSDDVDIFSTALERPASQSMNSEVEMADLGLIGPGFLNSSAPEGVWPAPAPAPALSTGTPPSQARCMQCVQSCVGSLANATEAVADYCTMIRSHRCSRNQQVGCALISLTCCSTLGVALGIYNAQN